jgi:stage III sporulation protein AF
MSLVIFLAQYSAKINNKICVVEPENMGDFLYDFKDSFENYNYYYKFEPYREIYIDNKDIRTIKLFSISITRWVENCKIEESKLIDKYNLSFTKIKKYAKKLTELCDFAINNGYGLLGQGD